MSIVDILILVFAVIMALAGWRSGFVRSAGSLVALIASVSASFYAMGWLNETYGLSLSSYPWTTITVFIVISIVANRFAHYIVDALDLVRKIVAIIPFVNLLNSILGAVFGLAQSAIAIAVLAYVAVTLVPVGDIRTSLLSSSAVSYAVDVESSMGIL